jgi:hypothetical protein
VSEYDSRFDKTDFSVRVRRLERPFRGTGYASVSIEDTAFGGVHNRGPFERDDFLEELRSSRVLVGMGE